MVLKALYARPPAGLSKTLLIMKFTAIILLSACLAANARGYSQKVTLSEKNALLDKVFKEIKKQTGYKFLYTDEMMQKAGRISIEVTSVELYDALNNIFKNQPLTYSIVDKVIVIREAANKDKPVPGPPPVTITGMVTTETGEPLEGASVEIKGTKRGTYTDAAGRFELKAVDSNSVLVIRFTGYTPQEIRLAGQTYISSKLSIAVTSLADVNVQVSTGYQTIPKERATGSFVQIENELFNRRVSSDVISRLEGITSGLVFNKQSGHELFTIRGRSTLASEPTPLIVLDNFPYDGDINNINPNDIESITILKDAAAASIWGARSGNGVVVINTKKGKFNQSPKVEFNSNITIISKPDIFYSPAYLNTSDYIDLEKSLFDKGYFDQDIANVATRPAITPVVEILAKKRNGMLSAAQAEEQINALRNFDVRNDFMKYIYQKSNKQQYALSLSGGSSNIIYKLFAGFDNNIDKLTNNSHRKININSAGTFQFIKNLEITTSVNFTQSNAVMNNENSFMSSAISTGNLKYSTMLYPYARLADAEGNHLAIVKDYRASYVDSMESLGFLNWHYRPLDEITLADNTSMAKNILLIANVKYKFNRHLNIELKYGNENQSGSGRIYRSLLTYNVRNQVNRFSQRNASTGLFIYPFPKGGTLNLSSNGFSAENVRGQINYNQSFKDKHIISAILGGEIRQTRVSSYSRTSYGYDDEFGTSVSNLNFATSVPVNPSGSATLPSSSGSILQSITRFLAYYFNGTYTLNNLYTFSVSARKDGANLFGVNANQKIVPLWSAGLGWNIYQEKLFKADWLSYLKLRATYGFNGNVYDGSAYLIARYINNAALTGLQYAEIVDPPNPDLKWERVKNINLGLDFAFKNEVFSGSLEIYKKQGLDLVELAPLAPSTGFTSFKGNAASTKTNGIDLVLNSLIINKSFKWRTNFLFNYVSDKIVRFDQKYVATDLVKNYGNSLYAVTGKPLFSLYSYRWAGISASGDPLGYYNGHASNNYTGIFNNSTIDSIIYHGSGRPTIFGALRNTFSWKGFSASVNITYKFNYFFRVPSASLNLQENLSSPHIDYLKRWQQPGDESFTTVPAIIYPNNANRNNFYRYSEVLVEKGDHIRLQDINISYTISGKKRLFQSAQVYMYINNLGILWRANDKKIDPDYQTGLFPEPKSFAFGFKTTFN
jgi:TonB-dependent starch-binding outer membrane protein SusC